MAAGGGAKKAEYASFVLSNTAIYPHQGRHFPRLRYDWLGMVFLLSTAVLLEVHQEMHSPSGALELEDFADLPLILGCCDTGKITLGSSVVDLLWFSTRSKMKSSGSDGRSSVCPAWFYCSLIDIMLLPHASVLCLAFFILSNPSSGRFDRKQACSITIKDQISIFQTGNRSCCIKSVSQPNSTEDLVNSTSNRRIDTINRFSCHDDKHRSVIKQTNYLKAR